MNAAVSRRLLLAASGQILMTTHSSQPNLQVKPQWLLPYW